MKVALDSNILAYAEGIDDEERYREAGRIVERLMPDETFVPVQVLGELFNVLTRRARYPRDYARQRVRRWSQAFKVLEAATDSFSTAVDLATDHHFTIWDAVILCTAARAGCRVLLSEDMHDGFHWAGTTVVNPFSDTPNPLLAKLLASR